MKLHVGKIARKIKINFRKKRFCVYFCDPLAMIIHDKNVKTSEAVSSLCAEQQTNGKIRKTEKVCVAMISWCMSIKNLQDEQRCGTALCLRVARTAFINLLYHKCLFDATAIVSGMRNFTKPGAKSCQKPCKATIRQIFPKKLKKGIDRGVEK